MTVYLSEIKTLCDQLDSIGAPIPDSEKIFGVLNGLGKDYESICAVIENSMDLVPAPTLDDVMSKLTAFDEKLQSYAVSSEVTPHQAFYTQRGGYSVEEEDSTEEDQEVVATQLKAGVFINSLVRLVDVEHNRTQEEEVRVQHVRSVENMVTLRSHVTSALISIIKLKFRKHWLL